MCLSIVILPIVLSYLLAQPIDASEGPKSSAVQGDYFQPDLSAADVLRARGFLAKEFNFHTKDGYKINLVRGRNPLINHGKSALAGTLPVLFIHGIISSSATFLASTSERTKPRDFSEHINELDTIETTDQLLELIGGDEQSIKNLPVLALNFGYEVWLMNKRGTNRSKGKRGFETRTLLQAIASVPATLLANGFFPLGGVEPGRPHKNSGSPEESHKNQTTPRPRADDHSSWTFLQELMVKAIALDRSPAALMDFGKFKEQFIQTFDPDYWNFSLDEQAEIDVPQAIDFVRGKSGCSRVHTVSLSAGGALILMAAADKPELASKIASAVLWAPSLNMGSAKDIVYQLSQLIPIVQSYSGPIPFVFNQEQITGLLQDLCSFRYTQRTLCARLFDLVFGFSGQQAPMTPAVLATLLQPTSYHELAHLGQFAHTPQPCKFKFNDPKKNLERYGQFDPPCYDLSRVQLRFISIYAGNQDILISPGDQNTTRTQLSSVQIKLEIVGSPKIYFNHAGSILHDQSDRLVLVPSLLDIRRAEISDEISNDASKCHLKSRRKSQS